jgi:transposase
MPLGKEWLRCDCGLNIDRDFNAAVILKTAASSAVAACGEFLPLAQPLLVAA